MPLDIGGIKTIVWDFDGVFYDYTPVFYQACVDANSAAACDLIDGLTTEEATTLVLQSYTDHHDCFTGLLARATSCGIDSDQFCKDLQTGHHKNKFGLIMERCPELLAPNEELIEGFEMSRELGITHVVATHSCKREWTLPAIQQMGLAHVFSEERVLDYADFGFENKGVSARAVAQAMSIGNSQPHETMFIEDGLSNLHVAKADFPTMAAAFKTNKPLVPEGIDVIINSPLAVLHMLLDPRLPRNQTLFSFETGVPTPEPFS